MKRYNLLAVITIAAVMFSGCAVWAPPASKGRVRGASRLPVLYTGPRARITVPEFEVTAGKASGPVGSGLRRMLIAALINSGRFAVSDGQLKGQNKTVDLMISAIVNEFEPQASGGEAGVGGGGGVGSGLMGGLLGLQLNKAHMSLDIRVLDTATSQVLAATRVQGQAVDMAGGIMSGVSGNWELDPDLVPYANTPMEKAIRICIVEAIRYVSQSIPENYYKY